MLETISNLLSAVQKYNPNQEDENDEIEQRETDILNPVPLVKNQSSINTFNTLNNVSATFMTIKLDVQTG